MFARPLSAAALAVAACAYAAPSAEACDQCGYDLCACPVVVVDPCCEPPEPGLKERIAARRLERLERRADRVRDRLAEDCCYPPIAAPVYPATYGHAPTAYTSNYGYSSYNYSSYGYADHGYGY